MDKYMNFNLQPPIFQGLPIPPKVGIPLRLYEPYILNCIASGVPVNEIHSQLQAIGYLQKYSTFAQYVRQKVLLKRTRSVHHSLQKPELEIKNVEEMKEVEGVKDRLNALLAPNKAIAALIDRARQRN